MGSEMCIRDSDGLVRRRAAEKSLFLMPTEASLVVPTSDVRPAPQCELDYISDAELKAKPLVDFDQLKRDRKRELSPEENAARTRALFAATQALGGDPSKMIISKAEEHADMGVTIGAMLAGILAFALTGLGGSLLLAQEFPDIAASLGFSYEHFTALFLSLIHI